MENEFDYREPTEEMEDIVLGPDAEHDSIQKLIEEKEEMEDQMRGIGKVEKVFSRTQKQLIGKVRYSEDKSFQIIVKGGHYEIYELENIWKYEEVNK